MSFTRRLRETRSDEFAIDLPAPLAEVNTMLCHVYGVLGEIGAQAEDVEVKIHKHELVVVLDRQSAIKRAGGAAVALPESRRSA